MSTLSQKISQRLARDIVDGVLKPGAKLEEIVLAKRFRVSRSPVRDALRELAATGLIESQPRRGFSVATIDLAGLLDLFEAASEVEGLCAKLCALRAGMAEKKQIELVHNRARKAVLDGDADSYAELNESFHQSIYIGARNRNLQALAANLRRFIAAGDLLPHLPQQRTLNLLSCGERRAIASWGDWSAEGRWVWWWKDRIDRAFVRRYSGALGR